MKNISISIITLLFLTSCSKVGGANPSQNEALKSISGVQEKKESGSMQKSLDSWLEKTWTPSIQKDENMKKIDENKERDFKLQEYVDKMNIYNKENNSSSDNSHAKKLDSLPVIGR